MSDEMVDIEKELERCESDCVYFIEKYIKLENPIKGEIPFEMYDFQKDLISSFRDNKFNVVLKARQLGVSTTIAAYVTWLMLFHAKETITVLTLNPRSLSEMIQKMIGETHFGYLTMTNSNDEITLKCKSNTVRISRSNTYRTSISLLIIDEAAFIYDLDEVWRAAYPSISTGGSCIVVSTRGRTKQNWFWETWENSIKRENDFHPTKLLWSVVPERDDNWFEDVKKKSSEENIKQEYLCTF